MKLRPDSEQIIYWEIKDYKGKKVWWKYHGTVVFLTRIVNYMKARSESA